LVSDGKALVKSLVAAEGSWRRLALLWESRLHEEDWKALLSTLRVSWTVQEELDDAAETFWTTRQSWVSVEDGSDVSAYACITSFSDARAYDGEPLSSADSLFPDLVTPAESKVGRIFREAALRHDVNSAALDLMPTWRHGSTTISTADRQVRGSATRALLELRLNSLSTTSPDRRIELYRTILYLFEADWAKEESLPTAYRHWYLRIVFEQLRDDARILTPSSIIEVLAASIKWKAVDVDGYLDVIDVIESKLASVHRMAEVLSPLGAYLRDSSHPLPTADSLRRLRQACSRAGLDDRDMREV
jgi:hypothetical protein